MAEGKAIIGEAQEVQEEVGEAAAQIAQEESAVATAEVPVVQEEHQEGHSSETAVVREESVQAEAPIAADQAAAPTERAVALSEEASAAAEARPERFSESVAPEVVASGHTDEIIMEEAPSKGEQVVAHKKISVEDAPIEGEHSIDEEAAPQGEHTESVPIDNEEHVEFEEPIARAHSKRKRVAHRKPKKKQLKVNFKPVIRRLNEQGKAITSMQSDIQSISISQTSAANEIGTLSTEVHSLRDDFKMFKQLCRWMKGEFDSVKKLISSREQSSSAPPIPPPTDPVSSSGPSQARQQEEDAGPSGPSGIAEDRPLGQIVVEPVGPSGPVKVVSGPTGSVVSEDVQSSVEELAVAPKAPESSSLATPAPSSPPSSSTAHPAPPTFKQPCEGKPGGIYGVVPFSVKEDLVVSRVLFPSCEGRPAGVLGVVVSLRGTVPLLVKS
ncbi:hypothetical protein Taro_019273 [Colocasia esculenta]|uniref:Uncharacterized protein n=1 Tax=Colocasia esculenta TaxID=4460 RepID=A0A843UTC7_COLES|nr:hypothetical protein [Colocasia esculenta]